MASSNDNAILIVVGIMVALVAIVAVNEYTGLVSKYIEASTSPTFISFIFVGLMGLIGLSTASFLFHGVLRPKDLWVAVAVIIGLFLIIAYGIPENMTILPAIQRL